MAQNVHAQVSVLSNCQPLFVFCSIIIIIQLRSLSLKSDPQFLPVSEMGKFHTVN